MKKLLMLILVFSLFFVSNVKADASFGVIKLVKGGVISGNNNASGSFNSTTDTYYPFGSSSDLWGLSLTPDNINATDFGIVASFTGTSYTTNYTTNYLKATNFGFSIPAGATIDGVYAEIEARISGSTDIYVDVDHIRITVYYTEAAGGGSQTMVSPVIIFE